MKQEGRFVRRSNTWLIGSPDTQHVEHELLPALSRQYGVAQAHDNHAYRRRNNYVAGLADSLMTQIAGRAHEPLRSFLLSLGRIRRKQKDSLNSWKQNEFRLSSAGESFSFSLLPCTKNTRKRERQRKSRHSQLTEFDPNQSRTVSWKGAKETRRESREEKVFVTQEVLCHTEREFQLRRIFFFIQYWLFKTRGSAHFLVSPSPFGITIHTR